MGDNILVLHGSSYGNAIEGLGNLVFDVNRFLSKPEDFKLILFTGGPDVDPSFYDDTSPLGACLSNLRRDVVERIAHNLALEYGILMAGICRGLQFLNVMAGGKMIHHLSGHGNTIHPMQLATGEEILVNSYHHQMILPAKGAEIVGWSGEILSKEYIGFGDEYVTYAGREYEAAIFPKTKAFGVQYHPESMPEHAEAYDYYRKMVENALMMGWEDFIELYTKGRKDVELFEIRERSSAASG